MATLKWVLVVAAAGYLALVALLYVVQRSMMYFPATVRTPPPAAGLPQAEEVVLDTADGEQVIAWHVPPRGDKPVILYFHGNGGALSHRADRFRALIADGTGLLALSYRGYGGSSGRPSETGLLQDAAAAYRFAAARYPSERIALWGESLGSGVAVALAAKQPVARVILEAPFTSTADIGAAAYPIVPVRLLMKDQFRSDQRIRKVRAPVLILHGEQDRVVPIAFGQRLYDLVIAPKKFVRMARGNHDDLGLHGAVEAAQAFLADQLELEPARAESTKQ
jgi:fermentation-respiration switch protein FrsA (DUF1100 family)